MVSSSTFVGLGLLPVHHFLRMMPCSIFSVTMKSLPVRLELKAKALLCVRLFKLGYRKRDAVYIRCRQPACVKTFI